MRACWLKWVGRDWSISADYIWLNYSDANKFTSLKYQANKQTNTDQKFFGGSTAFKKGLLKEIRKKAVSN